MNKPKMGKCLFVVMLLLAIMASSGICQPYRNYSAGGVSFTFNNSTNVLNITSSVGFGTNYDLLNNPTGGCNVGWYLSPNNSVWVGTDYLIGASSVSGIANFSSKPVTTSIDLDLVAGLPLTEGTIYYVGIFVCYDNFPSGEIMPYEWMYYDNDGCSTDPLKIGIDTQQPTITYSTPDSGAANVAITAPVKIVFSEWMATTGFTFTMLPNPGGVSGTWNAKHDTLSISHNAFAYAAAETISITHAEDLCGNLLAGRNVITFTTQSFTGPAITMKTQPSSPQTVAGPYLVQAVLTDPAEKGAKSITADTLYYRINGGSFNKLVAYAQTADTFSFQLPAIGTGLVEYYLKAWDNTGLSATAPSSGYYSFYVDTLHPAITYSTPDSGVVNVALNASVMVVFSEPMDTVSFTFTLLPNPGGVSRTWNTKRDTLRIAHNAFTYATVETLSITHAADLCGNLLTGRNVITFTTISNQGPVITMKTQPTSPQTVAGPYLVEAVITDPAKNGGKAITADSLYYQFNSGPWFPLGTFKVSGDTFSFQIPAIDSGLVAYYLQAWDNVNSSTIEPSSGCDSFFVNPLNPVITYSTPDSGAVNVAVNAQVMMVFSSPIDTLTFSYTLLPDPGGVSRTWNIGRDTLRIAHDAFASSTVEEINITYAADQFGHLLLGRNVITFTTLTIDPHWDDRFGTSGINNNVSAVAYDSFGNIYIGGAFTTAGGGTANYVAKWDGTSWTPLGSGMNGTVTSLAVSGTTLYAGGGFTTAGGVTIKHIAKWDGTSWSALGSGTLGSVYTVVVNGSDVYIGGSFSSVGGIAAIGVAKWDGVSWSALGSGILNYVYAIAVNESNVYVGGSFINVDGVTLNNIVKCNESIWSALGSGMNGPVRALSFRDGMLYAGGEFTTAGGVSAKYIAKWNGTSWSALGVGTNARILALAIHEVGVYAGGEFTTAGGDSAKYIAQWDGSVWSALGSGTDNYVQALASCDTCLNIGGAFATAGGKASVKFGMYHYFTSLPSAIELSSFTCQVAAEALTLSWRTESETGNCAWLIERSEQPKGGYNHIATIPAAGSTPTGQDYAYTDNAVKPGNTYYYKLGDQDLNGKVTWHGPVSSTTAGAGTITALSLLSCKPNPFSSTTNISYQLPKVGQVSLKVYNIAGQAVKTLVEETQDQGAYHVSWDGRDEDGRAAMAGVYFYRLSMAGENILRKMVLVK